MDKIMELPNEHIKSQHQNVGADQILNQCADKDTTAELNNGQEIKNFSNNKPKSSYIKNIISRLNIDAEKNNLRWKKCTTQGRVRMIETATRFTIRKRNSLSPIRMMKKRLKQFQDSYYTNSTSQKQFSIERKQKKSKRIQRKKIKSSRNIDFRIREIFSIYPSNELTFVRRIISFKLSI